MANGSPSSLKGPWIDTVPGTTPSPGIVRPDIDWGTFGAQQMNVTQMDNGQMDLSFPNPTGGQASSTSRR